MKPVIFLNENTLGHASYLPRFAEEFARHPEYGLAVETVDVAPLPAGRERWAADSIRGAVRFGFSAHYRRWREAASAHAAALLGERWKRGPAPVCVVANTQSVALDLPATLPGGLPLLLCLDATFTQLRRSAWFAPNTLSRWLQPWTIGDLIERERALFARASKLLPWSLPVAESLQRDYGVPAERIRCLPPSLPALPEAVERPSNSLPRILFLGGDFRRKGGPLLVECFQSYFQGQAELDIVTQTGAPEGPGVRVHKDIRSWSPEWLALWRAADLFVFPSRLETFGIVLLEAHAFGVPVIASRAGAAAELLQNGEAGWLLDDHSPGALRAAIAEALADPALRRRKAARGRALAAGRYLLGPNTQALASWIEEELRAR
jgi:glycosyltransferase involved in cell wall biosynthesis